MLYTPGLLDLLPAPSVLRAIGATLTILLVILTIKWIFNIHTAPRRDKSRQIRKRSERRPQNPDTMTIPQVETSTDYQAATPEQRAALDELDPATELVHEDDFREHAASVARDVIGDERCNRWPYRNIDLEDATEDLRASYARIRIGRSTYYYSQGEAE